MRSPPRLREFSPHSADALCGINSPSYSCSGITGTTSHPTICEHSPRDTFSFPTCRNLLRWTVFQSPLSRITLGCLPVDPLMAECPWRQASVPTCHRLLWERADSGRCLTETSAGCLLLVRTFRSGWEMRVVTACCTYCGPQEQRALIGLDAEPRSGDKCRPRTILFVTK